MEQRNIHTSKIEVMHINWFSCRFCELIFMLLQCCDYSSVGFTRNFKAQKQNAEPDLCSRLINIQHKGDSPDSIHCMNFIRDKQLFTIHHGLRLTVGTYAACLIISFMWQIFATSCIPLITTFQNINCYRCILYSLIKHINKQWISGAFFQFMKKAGNKPHGGTIFCLGSYMVNVA